MLFSSKPSYLLYIDRTSVKLFDKSSLVSEETISADAMRYLEVLDPGKLMTLISVPLATSNLQNETIVVLLGDDVVFRDVAELTPQSNPQAIQDELASKIPFEAQNRSILTLTKADKAVFFGVNKQLIITIRDAIKATHNKLTAVAPASAYGLRHDGHFTPEIITGILHNKAHVEKVNFLITIEGDKK